MTELFGDFQFWHWWILAAVLLILEVFAPGAFFLWMGVSAGIVGLVYYLVPAISWEVQLLLFAALSLVTVVVWRRYLKRNPIKTEQPALNRRGQQYVGRVFNLVEPIENGTGKIRVDDTLWKVKGTDAPSGARVRVTGVDGTVFQVALEEAGET